MLNHCSFDKKTGIWQDSNVKGTNNKDKEIFKDFKKIRSLDDEFKKTIPYNNKFAFKSTKPITNNEWKDIFYSSNNNFSNFAYDNKNQKIFKSKKITKNKVNNYKIFENGNLIVSDEKGNIIIFSVDENKKIAKFNFYKKKFKKIRKKLNFIVHKNIIFVADNLGYLYSYNYKLEKLLWAKNYKSPFRSNLKIFKNRLIVSDENNVLYFFDIDSGNLISQTPTEENLIKNKFINNLSISSNKLFFLNSYGSLYALDLNSMKIEWFIYLNQSNEESNFNLFRGTQVINYKGSTIVSSNNKSYIINENNGLIKKEFNFSSYIKPVIYNGVIFYVTKKNFLIAIDLKTNNILYSLNISKQVPELKKKNKNDEIFEKILILNNEIFILVKNSYLINFSIDGRFKKITKLASTFNTSPIFIQGLMLSLDKSNKLVIIN